MTKPARLSRYPKRVRYPDEAKRIQRALSEAGYKLSLVDAHEAWEQHSARLCAGFLDLPLEDASIARALLESVSPDTILDGHPLDDGSPIVIADEQALARDQHRRAKDEAWLKWAAEREALAYVRLRTELETVSTILQRIVDADRENPSLLKHGEDGSDKPTPSAIKRAMGRITRALEEAKHLLRQPPPEEGETP